VVEALLAPCPRLRLDDPPLGADLLSLRDGFVAEAEHDSAEECRRDQQARLLGLGLGLGKG